MLRQSLLATALVLSLVACTAESEPFDEQVSDDVTISDVTVTALDGVAESQRSYEISYTLSNDTGERIWVTRQRAPALLPDAHDAQTLVLMDDFPPEEEDNTSYAAPSFDIDLLKPEEAMSRRFDVVDIAIKDPLLDLAHMRVCVAFYRESSNASADEPLRPGTISQYLAHSWREVACSPATPMPEVFSG